MVLHSPEAVSAFVSDPPFPLDDGLVATPVLWYRSRKGRMLHAASSCPALRSGHVRVQHSLVAPPLPPCSRCFAVSALSAAGEHLIEADAVAELVVAAQNLMAQAASPSIGIRWLPLARAADMLARARQRVRRLGAAEAAAGAHVAAVEAALDAQVAAMGGVVADVVAYAVLHDHAVGASTSPFEPYMSEQRARLLCAGFRALYARARRANRDPFPELVALAERDCAGVDLSGPCRVWLDEADAAFAALQQSRGDVVLFGALPSGSETSLREALWWLHGGPFDTPAFVVVPDVVSRELLRFCNRDPHCSGPPLPRLVADAAPEDSPAVLSTAASLVADGMTPPAALDAARLLV